MFSFFMCSLNRTLRMYYRTRNTTAATNSNIFRNVNPRSIFKTAITSNFYCFLNDSLGNIEIVQNVNQIIPIHEEKVN